MSELLRSVFFLFREFRRVSKEEYFQRISEMPNPFYQIFQNNYDINIINYFKEFVEVYPDSYDFVSDCIRRSFNFIGYQPIEKIVYPNGKFFYYIGDVSVATICDDINWDIYIFETFTVTIIFNGKPRSIRLNNYRKKTFFDNLHQDDLTCNFKINGFEIQTSDGITANCIIEIFPGECDLFVDPEIIINNYILAVNITEIPPRIDFPREVVDIFSFISSLY